MSISSVLCFTNCVTKELFFFFNLVLGLILVIEKLFLFF